MVFEELNDIITDLAYTYELEEDYVKEIYISLKQRACFEEKDTIDCLDYVCSERASIIDVIETKKHNCKVENKYYNKRFERKYSFSDEYLINSALEYIYGDDAYKSLDQAYIDYIKGYKKCYIEPREEDYSYKADGHTAQLILQYQYNGDINFDDQE